jgi:hypothetical protein
VLLRPFAFFAFNFNRKIRSSSMSTAAQLAANHANAQLSTGPATSDGKAKSSLNALKTALTGQTVLLPSDDAVAYQSHLARLTAQWKAANQNEQALVQFIADTEWRLLRIPGIEMGIYAVGRFKLQAQFAEVEDATTRAALIEAEVFLTYQRQLSNLSLQESRLRRNREKDTAALRQMQTDRARRLDEAAQKYIDDVEEGIESEWLTNEIGFEFSVEEVELRAIAVQPDLFADWAAENDAKEAA